MRRKPPKTANDIVAHFQKRCLERIGIILNQRTLKEMFNTGKLILLEKQSLAKTKWLLKKERYNGKQMLQFDVIVVYDKRHHQFVTTWKHEPPVSKP